MILRKLYIDLDLSSYQISDLTGWSRTSINDYLRKAKINKESIKSPIPRYGERDVSDEGLKNFIYVADAFAGKGLTLEDILGVNISKHTKS